MNAVLHDANTWVALSFLVFMVGFFRYAVPSMIKALDARSEAIRSELSEAVRLREAAQALLAEFQQKQKEMSAEAEALLQAAKKDATSMAEQAEADIRAMTERRMRLAQENIARSEANALAGIKAMMIDAALLHTETLLRSELSEAQHQTLMDASIRDIKGALH